jgi:transcriptional regulator with XRE-family HTH domain
MNGHPIDTMVGRNLLRIRKARGLSQPALGKALGITFPQVQKYEKGINRISASTLYQIACVLRVSLDELFWGVEDGSSASQARDERAYPASEIDQIQSQAIQTALRSLVREISADRTKAEFENGASLKLA